MEEYTGPFVYPVVDMFCMIGGKVVVGRKASDPIDHWRLPGGYIDVADPTADHAAIRELTEEAFTCDFDELTSLIDRMKFLFTTKIPKGAPNSLISLVFYLELDVQAESYLQAGDDLDEVKLIDLNEFFEILMVEDHVNIREQIKCTIH
jgi:ADP-ribose pyrophosphatase YjhB (NUDIX family)